MLRNLTMLPHLFRSMQCRFSSTDKSRPSENPNKSFKFQFLQSNSIYPHVIKVLTICTLQVRPGEPVYAQVNREKKRSRGGEAGHPGQGYADYGDHGQHWVVTEGNGGAVLDTQTAHPAPGNQGQGGDSWV